MNLLEIRRLTIDNKTIAQWHMEIKSQAHYFAEKYNSCFNDRRYTVPMIRFYRQTKDIYFELNELLYHIDKYDAIVSPNNCASCKHNLTHKANLQKTFTKYHKFIAKCRDGYRIKSHQQSPVVLFDDV